MPLQEAPGEEPSAGALALCSMAMPPPAAPPACRAPLPQPTEQSITSGIKSKRKPSSPLLLCGSCSRRGLLQHVHPLIDQAVAAVPQPRLPARAARLDRRHDRRLAVVCGSGAQGVVRLRHRQPRPSRSRAAESRMPRDPTPHPAPALCCTLSSARPSSAPRGE